MLNTDSRVTASRFTANIAVMAAMVAILDSIPMIPGFYSGVWDSWLFLISPLIGVLLGPYGGALSVAIGTLTGHLVYFRDPYELVFMLGAPTGAAVSGLVYEKRWGPVLILYSGLLLAYLATPVSWVLPLWGVWDILAGYLVVLVFAVSVRLNWRRVVSPIMTKVGLVFSTVIGLESDILTRVFIFIPCDTYRLFYGLNTEQLQILWLGAGVTTPLKVAIAVIVAVTIGTALSRQLRTQPSRPEDQLNNH